MTALQEADQGKKEVFLSCPWKEGSVKVVVQAGSKEVGTAEVKLLPGGIRRWLVLGPFRPRKGAPPEPPPPPKGIPGPGALQAGRIWVPANAAEEPFRLKWLGSNTSGWIAAPLAVAKRVTLRAMVGLSGLKAALYLDGRKLAEGVGDAPFAGKAIEKKLLLTPGVHWLGLALSRSREGEPQVQVNLEKGRGGAPEGICVWPYNPDKRPAKFYLSGRVQVAWRGIPGVKVELVDAKGRKRTARTGAEGLFVFPRLGKGSYTLRPRLKGRKWKPPERKVFLHDGHLWGQNFSVEDKAPPRLEVLSPRPGPVHRVIHVRVKAGDDLGIQYLEWRIDGKRRGDRDYSPPYMTDIYLRRADKGRHTLTILARDFAGNETKKDVKILVR